MFITNDDDDDKWWGEPLVPEEKYQGKGNL
jgi:hypothetical protein